jgi:hypothetical protein
MTDLPTWGRRSIGASRSEPASIPSFAQDFVSLAGAFKRQSQRPCECLSWCLPSEGRQARHGGDVAVVDPEAAQGVVQVFAEGSWPVRVMTALRRP